MDSCGEIFFRGGNYVVVTQPPLVSVHEKERFKGYYYPLLPT